MDEKTYQHLLGRVRKRNMTLRNGESADPTNEPEIPPPTPAEMTAMAASELKHSISTCVYNIDSYAVSPDKDDVTLAVLQGYRAELINLRNLPGSENVINAECKRLVDAVSDILDYQFRFETL